MRGSSLQGAGHDREHLHAVNEELGGEGLQLDVVRVGGPATNPLRHETGAEPPGQRDQLGLDLEIVGDGALGEEGEDRPEQVKGRTRQGQTLNGIHVTAPCKGAMDRRIFFRQQIQGLDAARDRALALGEHQSLREGGDQSVDAGFDGGRGG